MVTIIHGGHREGLCFKAYNMFKQILNEKEIEVKSYSLRDYDFKFCCGDQACQNSGMCTYRDIISDEIIPAIIKSDAIIFFTPTYFNMPPAMLKNFMDRCNFLLTIVDRKHPIFGVWISGQTEKDSLEENYNCFVTFANICEFELIENGKIIRVESDITNKHLNQDDVNELQKMAKEVSTLK